MAMGEYRRFDVPSWIITLAERIPGNPWQAFNSEDIVDPMGKPTDWLPASADPEASKLFFIKRKALVVAAGMVAVDEAIHSSEGYPAAAYMYRDVAHMRILPTGFASFMSERELSVGVALGEGLNDFHVQMGFWVPPERTLVVPRDTRVLEQHIDKKGLPAKYRGLPLV